MGVVDETVDRKVGEEMGGKMEGGWERSREAGWQRGGRNEEKVAGRLLVTVARLVCSGSGYRALTPALH